MSYYDVIAEELTAAEAIERASLPNPHEDMARASRSAEHDSWGGGTFDDIVALATRGYPDGARKLRNVGLLARIREVTRPAPVWDTSGSTVDVGRFLGGEPECMQQVVRRNRPSPVVRIAVERCVHSGISPQEILRTGAAVLAAVEALRTAGIPAEIWATFTVQAGTRKMHSRVLVQRAGMAVDVDVLAFWLMHPGALRRIGFGLWEQQSREVRKEFRFLTPGTYSHPTIHLLTGEYDENVPAYGDAVIEWVRSLLKRRVGVEIRREDIEP